MARRTYGAAPVPEKNKVPVGEEAKAEPKLEPKPEAVAKPEPKAEVTKKLKREPKAKPAREKAEAKPEEPNAEEPKKGPKERKSFSQAVKPWVDKAKTFTAHVVERAKTEETFRKHLILGGIAAFLLLVVLVLAMTLMGNKYGYKTPQKAGEALVSAMSCDRPDSAVLDVFTPAARRAGYAVDLMEIANTRRTAMRSSITLTDVRTTSVEPLDDDVVEELRRGLRKAYADADDVQAASMVTVSATMKPADGEASETSFHAIMVKSKGRWFAYTGEPVSVSRHFGFEDGFFGGIPDDETEARRELRSGKFTVDGLDITMPASYNSFISIFQVEESRKDYPLAGNQGAMHVPIVLANDDYDPECFSVGISNTDVEATDQFKALAECSVTNLFMAKTNKDGLSSPDVQLPGGIRFGSSYDEVVAAYGPMERYSHVEGSDGYNRYAESAPGATETYRIDMDARGYNEIYLSFRDGELAGVQWYYYDLRSE